MDRKIAIVTGANSGIGLETAIGLTRKGYFVILACRSEQRGKQAMNEVAERGDGELSQLMLLDLASLKSIRSFAEAFQQQFDRLDVLVNNAGVMTKRRKVTTDGFEMMMGVNYLGHFLLTHLLLKSLAKSAQGRIVNVSSSMHKNGNIDFANPYLEKGYTMNKGYAQSKLANVLFTRELSRRLADTKITTNALHPGNVLTNIMGVDKNSGFIWYCLHHLFNLLPSVVEAEKGAETSLYLATSSEVTEISGEYFSEKKISPISERAKDDQLAKQLWAWGEQEVGLERTIQAFK